MKIVAVKWIDSTTFNFWAGKEFVMDSTCREAYTVGILVGEDELKLTVALISSEDHEDFAGWVNIPQGCILERMELGDLEFEEEEK